MSQSDDEKAYEELKKHIESQLLGYDVFRTSISAGPAATPKVEPPKPPPVKWENVIGQVAAKKALRDIVEGATKNAEIYKKYGRKPSKGVLLFGPPGNGKTMLAKAVASALADLHGQASKESGFIYVKGPELFNMYVGETERNIRRLFERARAHKRQHGYNAVIFLDEAETLLAERKNVRSDHGPVQTFLAEMDGLEDSGAFLLLATNQPHALDSAVTREGRIDRKIRVGSPSQADALDFFEAGLKGKPLDGDETEIAIAAADALYDAKHGLYEVTLKDGTKKVATLGDFTSGAQITYLVDVAASFAMDRELETGELGGIRAEDFVAAVERTLREQRDLDHKDQLIAFCDPFARDVVDVERIRANGKVAKKSLIAAVPKGVKLEFDQERIAC